MTEPNPHPSKTIDDEHRRPARHSASTTTLRILDAALNRAGEGLRVVEDYLRLALDDGHLAQLAKQMRHDLATLTQSLPMETRLSCRDTLGDVGTLNTTAAERSRDTLVGVAIASFRRTAEALRSVEEYGKLLGGNLSTGCEQLRYRLYTLEKATLLTTSAQQRLSGVRLYVLVDGADSLAAFRERVATLVAAGVQAIQLRDKQLDDRTLVARGEALVASARPTGVLTIMNDRADLAAAAGVDGVHLGQDDLSVAAARRILGPDAVIGVSTHAIDQARQAVLDGSNYLGAGPTFTSTTKQFANFAGLDYLRQLADEVSLPTFAIGGITATNLPSVLATGIHRVAVAGAITGASDPAAAVKALLSELNNSSASETAAEV